MKCKDFAAPDVVTYIKPENSAAVHQNLLYILNLFADFFKLPLHIHNYAGNSRIVGL